MDKTDAIRYLLREGHSTPERICAAVDDTTLIDGCVVDDDSPWIADDGNQEVEYDSGCYTSGEAAREYVDGGDWGSDLNGSVAVSVWRIGIDADGDDCRVQEETFTIDLADALDHAPAIRDAMGGAGCGDSPDDHDWTSDGEGGCDENPGVWSTGGTGMSFSDHCRRCGLHRSTHDPGWQRNPGEGVAVEYRALSGEEIEWHRSNGSMYAD